MKKYKSLTFVLGGLNYGGAERVASHLIQAWSQQGRELKIISRRGPDNDFFYISESIPRINLGGEGESSNKILALFKNIPYVLKLRKAIKLCGSEVVISFLTKTNIHTILACVGLSKKIIISERNDTTRQNYPWPWPLLRKWFYRFADVVTANSEIAISGMEAYVPKQKLVMVPNPVILPEKTAFPERSYIILSVGRVVPHKAHSLIIEAFNELDERTKNHWEFHLLGNGEELKNLKQLSGKLNLQKQVSFHGLVNNTSKHYSDAGIFVLASEYEGTPNVLLEAMSFGLPCIVSDSLPGALEYINDGNNGLVFKSGDYHDLKEKLQFLIGKAELRKAMGSKARGEVEKLSLENIMHVWSEIIDD